MNLRALRAVAPLLFVLPLAAGDPLSLPQGTEIVLTPRGNMSSISLVGNQLTLNADTVMKITPDPSGLSVSREWVLPAGTVITLNLGSGLTVRRMDLRHSVELEIVTSTDGGQVQTFGTTTTSTGTMAIDPDPGTGNSVPPA